MPVGSKASNVLTRVEKVGRSVCSNFQHINMKSKLRNIDGNSNKITHTFEGYANHHE